MLRIIEIFKSVNLFLLVGCFICEAQLIVHYLVIQDNTPLKYYSKRAADILKNQFSKSNNNNKLDKKTNSDGRKCTEVGKDQTL
jgi:hypothetical protein